MENQNKPSNNPNNQKENLLELMEKYNQINSKLEEYARSLELGKVQDAIKEDLAFTGTWTKKQWDDITLEGLHAQQAFEASLNQEQKALYEKAKAFQTVLALASNDMKKR